MLLTLYLLPFVDPTCTDPRQGQALLEPLIHLVFRRGTVTGEVDEQQLPCDWNVRHISAGVGYRVNPPITESTLPLKQCTSP